MVNKQRYRTVPSPASKQSRLYPPPPPHVLIFFEKWGIQTQRWLKKINSKNIWKRRLCFFFVCFRFISKSSRRVNLTQLYFLVISNSCKKLKMSPLPQNFFLIFCDFSVLFFRVIFCSYETNSVSALNSRFLISISDWHFVEKNSLHILQRFKAMSGSKNQEKLFVHESE